jgi:hypothetical protein
MPRRVVLFSLLILGLLLPAQAQARNGFKLPSSKVLDCRSGDDASSRMATFQGRMRAIPGTARMLMRFTLMERFGDQKLQPVAVPELRAWRSAKPGIKDFRYKQTVTGLQGGGDYRAAIDFRWLDGDGNLLRKVRKLSGACHQQGDLANLKIASPTSALPGSEGTERYIVRVTNDGKAVARDVAVELFVDGTSANVQHIEAVDPGETEEVSFTGPACKRNLKMSVDPNDAIKELIEADNVTTIRCPALPGS